MRLWVLLLLLPLAGCLGGSPDVVPATPRLDVEITWEPEAPRVGDPVTFRAAIRSNVPDDQVLDVAWRIESTDYAEARPEHRFLFSGLQDIQVEVTTTGTGTTTHNASLTVLPRGAAPPSAPPPAPEPVIEEGAPLEILSVVEGPTASFSYSWSQEAELLSWDFGDGSTSKERAPTHTYAARGLYTVTLRASSAEELAQATTVVEVLETGKQPHVLVGVVDSGINPYHEVYYRPERTAHPCTYIEDFPCDIPALELTVGPGVQSWQQAFQADQAKWESIRPGQWFWIPQTAFVAVHCAGLWDAANGDLCILDDSSMHGTGTTSSVLSENPDALLAFAEGALVSDITVFEEKKLPVDVLSLSLGFGGVPLIGLPAAPLPLGLCDVLIELPRKTIVVQSSGNEPGLSILLDCWSGAPGLITVGGASAASDGQEVFAYKDMDVVSYFCRPTAQTRSLSGERSSYCGTSFSAPTVAGALSKVILGLRETSGYTGGLDGDMVDPVLGISKADLRDALNVTASYSPQARYSNGCSLLGLGTCVPKNPAAPWLQWGWGFYDGWVADDTLVHLLGQPATPKSPAAVAHMEAVHAARQALYG